MKNYVSKLLPVYILLIVFSIFTNHSQLFGQCNVKLPKDFIECNNSTVIVQSNTDYVPTYSTNNPGDTYLWKISGGPYSYAGGTDSLSRYPKINYGSGYVYTIALQFKNGAGTCVDSQVVYRQVGLTAQIVNPLQADTTVCANSTAIDLLGMVGGPYTSLLWSSNGSGSFSTTSSLSTKYTFSLADKTNGSITVIFKAIAQTNGSCFPEAADTVTIRFNPAGAKDSSIAYCSDSRLNYQPTTVQPGTYFNWTSQLVSGSASGNSSSGTGKITDSLINNSTTSDAVVKYTITPINGACSAPPVYYQVTLKPKPVGAAFNQIICTGGTANLELSSSIAGSLFSWTSTVIAGNATGNSSAATPLNVTSINDVLINGGSTAASVKYTITPYSPFGCIGPSFNATVTVNPSVTLANAGADRTICLQDSIHLNGNTPTSGNGSWRQLSGPTTTIITTSTDANATVTNLQPGVYKFIWTISNGVCASSTDTVVINISTPSVGGKLSGSATVCATTNTGIITLSNQTGNIVKWEASSDNGQSWNNINNTTNSYTYNNLTTTTWYRATIQSGVCAPAFSDTAIITVYQAVTLANAGPDRTICLQDSIYLNGNTPTSGAGSWRQLSGPTTTIITTLTDANATVTNLQPGSYKFIWTISNGVCASSSDTVVINISTPSVGGKLTGSATVCATSNTGIITLSNQTGNIVKWEASSDNGQSWNNISNTTNSYTYNNLTTTTWYRATIQSGVCSPAFSDTAIITVYQAVTLADAGADRTICLQDSIHLNGNTPTSGNGSWRQLSGPTTTIITTSTDANATVTNLQPGVYKFIWTISNGVCASSTDTVVINISTPSVGGKLSGSATVCATTNTGIITLSNQTGNIVKWEASSDNGQSWNNINNTTNSYTYNNLTTTTWYRATIQSGVCSPAFSDTAIITVYQAVTLANAGAERTICLQDSIHLNGNTPTSGAGSWRQLSGPTTTIITTSTDANASVTNLQPGSYKFIWTISNGVCASSSDTVVINISTPSIGGKLTGSATVCATNNTGIITLSNQTGNIVKWEASSDNGQSWNNISNTTNSYTYNNLTTTTWYRATIQSGVCSPAFSDTAIITVYQAVTLANAGADRTICLQDSIHLNGNTPTSGNGSWRQLSGPTTTIITTSTDANATVTNLQPGVYKFIWTISNGVCASSTDTVVINISTPSVGGKLSGSATVCATTNTGIITLSNQTGNIVKWEASSDNGQSWNNINNTTNSYTYNNLTTTTWYRATIQSGVCAPAFSDTAIITVYQAVTLANAGPDRTICLQDSIYLNGNTPTSGAGSWRQLSGPTTTIITTLTDANATVTNLQPGSYKFIWTISNGVCASSSDTVVINISTPSVGGKLTGSATVCATSNTGIITLSNQTGNIVKWEASSDNGQSWNNISNTTNSYTYNNLTTTTWYRATIQSGVCSPAFSDTAIITVYQAVTLANAGPDRTLCLQDSIHLNGNIPTSGTGSWRQLSGPTTTIITTSTDANATVTNLQPGVYKFIWTISNGVCASSTDTVVINISTPSVGGKLSGSATVCATTNTGIITLSNQTGNIVKWEASSDNGQSWNNINNTTNSYTYNNLTTTTWYRATIQSGVCSPAFSDTAIITVYQAVTLANAGAERTICLQDSIHLNGNTPTSGAGSWRQLSGPTTTIITTSTDANASVTNLQPGSYKFIWTISNGVCASSSDTVVINISTPSIGGKLTGSATVCATNNTGIITLSNQTGNIVKWEASSDNGQSWNNISNTTNSYTYNNLTTTTWYRATIQSGVCSPAFSDTAIITVYQAVTLANAGADRTICLQDSIHLNGNTPTSGNGSWRQLSGPTTTIITTSTDANATVTNLQPGVYKFIWTISNGVCASSTDTVVINISTPSVGGKLSGSATVCATTNTGIITLSNQTGNIVKWEASSDNGQSWNNINNTTNSYTYNNLTTTTWYRATIQSGVCAPAFSDTAIITVYQAVTLANAGPDRTICLQDSIYLNGNTPTSGAGSWRQLSGPTTTIITTLTDANATVTNLQPGSYKFIWTISNGVCASSSDTVVINISTPSVGGKLTGSATVCATSNTGIITLSNQTGNIVKWEASSDNGQSWNNISNTTNSYTYNNLTTTTWYRATIQSGVCSPAFSDTAIITVYQAVTLANAGPDRTLCLQDSIHLNGNIPTSGTGSWRQLSGPTTTIITTSTDANATVTNLQPGSYKFIWTISNGVCASSSDTVAINISTPINNVIDTTTQTVCNGSSVTISNNNISGGSGSYQYQWEMSYDGNSWVAIAGAKQPTYTFTPDTTIYLRRSIVSGPCNAVSAIVKVNVQKNIAGNLIQADQSICFGENAANIVGSVPTGGNNIYIYSWEQSINGGNTWTSVQNAIGKDLTPGTIAQNTLFRRTVKSGFCFGVYSSISNQVLVTVNPHSKAAFDVTKTISCAPFIIDSSIVKVERHDDLNKDYLWYTNNTFIGNGPAFPGYVLQHPQDSVTIKLRVTSLFNCKDDSANFALHVVPLPQPAFTLSDTIGCGPLTINFTNETPLASQYSYVWDFGNGTKSTSAQPQSVTYIPASVGTDTTYIVKLTAFDKCDTITVSQKIHIRLKPKASFGAFPTSGCSPLLVNFNAFINSTNSTSRFYFGDGTDTTINVSSGYAHLYQSSVTKVFNAKLVTANECGSDSLTVPVKTIAIDANLKFDIIDSAGCAPFTPTLINKSTGTVSYTWTLGDGTSLTSAASDTIKHLYTTPGIYSVRLTAHHQCGDTSLLRNVYVHEVPKAGFSSASASICIGDSIKFNNTGTITTNYLWSFGDGASSASSNPSHAYTDKGNYTVWQKAIQKYATGVSCIDSISHPVNIVDHQPGKMVLSDTAGVCLPFSVTFINTNQPSALTTWYFGDGSTTTGDTVTHIYTAGGTFIATMVAQSAAGCVYTDTTNITVRPPDGALNYTAATYCGDNNTRFAITGQNIDSLVWHFGDGTTLYTSDSIVYHSYKSGAYLPWVELLGQSGCRKIIPGTDAIRVEQLQAGFTWKAENNCGYTNVQFTDTTRSYFGLDEWQWSFGDGSVAKGKDVQHQYNKSGSYTIRLIVSGTLGCIDTVTIPINVVVSNKPKASIQANSSTCVLSPIQFTANVASIDSVSTYKWNMGNGKTLQGKSVSATYTNAGTYTVNLIAGTVNGCYDTASVPVVANPLPVLVTSKQYQICKGQQQVLQTPNGLKVTWSNDQGIICSNCNQTTVAPFVTTTYYVSGTNQYGCSATDTVLVKVIQPFNMRTSPGDTLCLYGQTNLYATGATTYSWSPSDGLNRADIPNPVAKPLASTIYRVIGKDSYGCFADTGRVSVVVGTASQVRLGSDTVVVAGSSIIINANTYGPNITKYAWSSVAQLSCNTCTSTIATVRNDACISCTVTNMYGCKTSDTLCVKTFCKSAQVFIPNAFSPDGDGVNDVFFVMGTGIKMVKTFRIFNRWGELIFEKLNFYPNEPAFGWDGTIRGQKASPEVFVYICDVVCENDIPYTYKGNVAIIK